MSGLLSRRTKSKMQFSLLKSLIFPKCKSLFLRNEEQTIEGAAGVALASMIKKSPEIKGKFVVAVLCGGNIDEKIHSKILFDRKKVRKTKIIRSLEEPEIK
jgi:threonine dehydratase